MAFSDRDYNQYHPAEERRRSGNGMSVTMIIVIINIVLWLANGLFFEHNSLTDLLLLRASAFNNPYEWWQFITYGFVHDPTTLWHIGGNLIMLIMFGYGMMLGIGSGGFELVRGENVEDHLGRIEYLFFYLVTILLGGIVFALTHDCSVRAMALGASGGITGIVILYAWLFPNRVLYLYGILPVPMWVLGIFFVMMDSMGVMGLNTEGIGYSIHLTGAAFATAYYLLFLRRGVRLTDNFYISLATTRKKNKKPKPFRPKLRVFTEDGNETEGSDADFNRRLDEILGRYGQVGESGLTQEEREFLQRASRRYRDKHL